MERKDYMNSDLMKFYYSLVPENNMDDHFENEMFSTFLKIARREIPAEDLCKEPFEILYGDGVFVSAIRYMDSELWFDDNVIDEEENEYVNSEVNPLALRISRPGTIIISPEIVVGEKLDSNTVFEILNGNAAGNVGEMDFGDGKTMIQCSMANYELDFWLQDGILKTGEIIAFGNPNI